MATSDILGLFASPQQYEQQRQAAMEAQALRMAELNPMQQGQYGIALGAQQLGRAIGGALGGVDPQLQKITQRQQLLGMIDPNNPDSYAQAIQAALQTGDQEAAFLLRNEMMRVKQQAQEQQLTQFKTEDYLTQRGLGMQQRGMESRALSIANGIDPDTGEPTTPLLDPRTQTFNQDVANTLISKYGQIGANIVKQRVEGVQGIESLQVQQLAKTLFNPDGTRNPEVEKQLSTSIAGREILKKLAPETKELKKGEKLVERQPNGTWKIVTPEGQPVQTVSSDNAVQALIAGNAIHPTVLPYATQLAKNFANLDFEDQNVLMEKLTRLNSDAKSTESSLNLRQDMFESNKAFKEAIAASSAGMKSLQKELIQLKIDQAKQAQVKAADGKEINIASSTRLSNQAIDADKLVDLYTKFKPNYAGYATDKIGDLAVWAASKSSDPEDIKLYQWWQSYQDHVNKVRNDLFGAALTAPEKAEFEKSMVTKGMDSTQAEENLKRQADAALKAYEKLDKSLRVQGFSKSALDVLKPTGFIGQPASSLEIPAGVTITVKKKGG
jgi:hypothetical protein